MYIHRQNASRELIDIISSLSFADDYAEVQRLEQALLSHGDLSHDLGSFTQIVFDNTDFNAATLTENNTFHSMSGIACVTPPGRVNEARIKHEVKLQSAKIIGAVGQISIETYNKPAVIDLQ